MMFLARDREFTPASEPLKRIERRGAIWAFVILELIGFGATFAITQTIAAIGFPVFILVLIPIRTFLLPRWFTYEELSALDGPTASPFTMESVGGTYGFSDDESGNDLTSSTQGGAHSGVLAGAGLSGQRPDGSRSSSDSAIEDELERGEVYEMQPTPSMRRRSRVEERG